MKKIIFFFLIFIFTKQIVSAQVENDICTAVCLPANGILTGQNPAANGESPHIMLPCGQGTSEDNPTWYKFIPTGTSISFNVSTMNCVGTVTSPSIQVTVFEGNDCIDTNDNLFSIGCLDCVNSGTLTANVIPNKMYWLQIDGCLESICDFTLTYNPSSVATNFANATISGSNTVCKGSTTAYKVNAKSNWAWKIQPAQSATIINIANHPDSINVIWNSTGNIKICATSGSSCVGNGNPVTICKDVTVTATLNPSTCNITLCKKQLPYTYALLPCINALNPSVMSVTPTSTILTNSALGTYNQSVTYQSNNGCTGTATVIYKVDKDSISTALATPKPISLKKQPCVGDEVKYFVAATAGVQHEWSVTGGVFKSSNIGDSVTVKWNGTAPFKVCAKATKGCATSPEGCLTVSKFLTYDTTTYSNFVLPYKNIKIALKPIILQKNPNLVGNPIPSTYIFPGAAPGYYKKVISYTIDSTGCTGYIALYIVVLKKGKIGGNKPNKEDGNLSLDEQNIINELQKNSDVTWQTLDNIPSLTVFPNPSKGIFMIGVTNAVDYEIEVFDVVGKRILQDKNTTTIDLQTFQNGVYYLKIKQQDWSETVKLMKL